MTDTFDQTVDGEDNRTVTLSRKDIKRLEAQAKEGREAKSRLEQLERERAYVNAGVPLEDKRTPYFMAGYQGEMTPEAIRAKWDEDFGGGGQATGNPIAQELNDLNRSQELVGGGVQVPPNRLAERDSKLKALSDTDPQYDFKFRAIFEEYGGQLGNMNG